MHQLHSSHFAEDLSIGVPGNVLVFVRRGGPLDDTFERVFANVAAYMPQVTLAVTPVTRELSEKFRKRSTQMLEMLGSVLLFYQNGEPRGRLSVYSNNNGQMIDESVIVQFVNKYVGGPLPQPPQPPQPLVPFAPAPSFAVANKYKNIVVGGGGGGQRHGKGTSAGDAAIYANEVENFFLQTQYGTQPPIHAPPFWSLRVDGARRL